jgi:energy-coupling factor transporter ATP-binding protein EcfA2
MPKQSYGKINQQRSQILLLALLSFANDELEAEDKELERLRSQIQTHWQTEKKLVVRTKTRYLESLIKLIGREVLSIDHIKTALKHLENHVGILDDHRTAQRGSDNWHFTINLWFDRWQQTANLEAFARAWLGSSGEKSTDRDEGDRPAKSLEMTSKSQSTLDWPSLCRQALDTSLSSNPLMTNIGKAFDLNDLYLPLGVEERRFIRGDEEDTIQYHPTELIAKLLAANETNRIAIIGTPGAGKTTLLQKIAQSLSETSGCLPIWISLAELGEQSLENYLTQNWLKDSLRLFQVSPQQQQELVAQVQAGRVWLLLDAIDEMGATSGALTYLAKQFKGWLSPAHVVLTCRSNLWDGEKNALMDFETYQILSFKHTPDGVPAFILRWFQGNPELGHKLALRLTQKSMERIHSCVTNPLYLALLCRSWMLNQGQLPSTKTSLYRQFVEAIYSWKQDLFPTTLRQRQSLNQLLAALALQAMQQRDNIFRLSSTLVLAAFAADLDLLTLALNLGLLKQSGYSIATGDPIYGFHHPTFQEYFAAQAIADRQQFFTFNIFDLKWREVLPLWLGREDIADGAKEELLQCLLDFEDNCGGFYCYRAYFLAAEGVAEFPAFSAGDEIVAKLVVLRYLGSFDRTVPTTITERAGIALSKTDRRRAVRALEQFIEIPTPENFQAVWLAAHSLGRNYDAENSRAIATLETLLVNALDNYSKFSVAKSLIGIVPEHAVAIETLVQIVKSFEYPALQRRAARRLQMIGVDNPLVAGILAELRIEPQLAEIFSSIENAPKNPSSQRDRQSKENLGDPQKIIESIVRKLQSNNSVNTKIRLANHLAKYKPDHPLVLESLLYCLKHCDQKAYLKQVGESLRSLVSIADLPLVLPKVRDIYLESQNNNPEPYHESYRILWYWSRSIGHPEFESLWNLSSQTL